ncbi:MAG TPA: hypothetical protein VGX25_19815 [Actinophytocola sp.]|uniref:hypothetical protein n=1 Tax=Actinophytocola sp. TaxID=1872138 RepID=UPI002DDD1C3A|nr:hypothetical protein [Actinophytocola sp.]HEV2781637.1 hypothetical protein [Actinophytocola sp.]
MRQRRRAADLFAATQRLVAILPPAGCAAAILICLAGGWLAARRASSPLVWPGVAVVVWFAALIGTSSIAGVD